MRQQLNRWPVLAALCVLPVVGFAAQALRDPTRPPVDAPATPVAAPPVSKQQVQLALQSVLVSDLRRQALINDRLVQVGDRLAGMLVVEITSAGVVLKDAGQTLRLSLSTDRVDKHSSQSKKPAQGRRQGS